MYFALISNPKNLARIDRYREIAQRLAHPQGLTDERGPGSSRAKGKAFVHIDGGCHATEVAGPADDPAARLRPGDAAPNDPQVKEILENVVVMLWPTMNPDGQQMVGEWFREEPRHAVRAVGPAAPLPGVRRPRQQPRRAT